MHCASCGHTNRDDAKFCLACGVPLVVRCDACERELPPGARFCDACGAPAATAGAGAVRSPTAAVDPPRGSRGTAPAAYTPNHLASKILTQRSALEGERKQVTVLFTDVADSTALAERLDPEEMHDIMDRCFQLLLAEVHRYEGTVNQFTGDGIMALFGAPIAHEDAPERAVRAALGMQAALQHFGAELHTSGGIDFKMRIGVNTGLVVVGKIGDDLRMDYTAIGDTTNLAARLQTAAPPGGILIGESTAKLVAGRFVTRPVGPLSLKGKADPVPAHEVLRALPRLPLVAPSERGLTPLAGRIAELAALETVFEHVRNGRGQITFVVGEAGIGKSRLLYEFRHRLADEPVSWIEGRCVSFGHSIPLLPVLDIVKALLGIDESDSDAQIADKIQRGLQTVQPDVEWTAPYLRTLLAVDSGDAVTRSMDAGARRFATFDAIKRVLLASAVHQPLVILIEDLHWIDQASEEFLTYIADVLATASILLVCTYRPGYRPALGERSYTTRVALQPLSPAQSGAMAAAMLDVAGLPAEIHALIGHKAEGNPFFVEEITKSLLEIGALRQTPEGFVLGRPVDQIVIPDRIQDVIMARLDRLGEDSKRAMQVASVIGREFAIRLLQRAAELGEHVDRLVGELRSLELIYEKSGVPELAYMFKHALTHDVAYESLLLQRRRHLHGIIGRAVVELYADRLAEYWETLAHHFYRAEDWPRAFEYLVKAGDKARASYANREALHFYDRALEVGKRLDVAPQRLATIYEGKGHAAFCLSQFSEAVEAFAAALTLFTEPGERARINAAQAEALIWAHEFDAALAAASEAAAQAHAAGDTTIAGMANFSLAFVHMLRGDLERAEGVFTESTNLARRSGATVLRARNELYRALRANWRGEYSTAIEGCGPFLRGLQDANELLALTEAYSHFGIALGGAGDYARVLPHLAEGITLAESIGDKVWRARMWNTRGWLLGELGAYDAADEANRRCLEFMQQLGSLRFASEFVANAEINLADVALWRGDLAAAETHLNTVAAILADARNEWMTWRYGMHFHASAAELAVARANLGLAREHLETCLATARRTQSRRYLVRANRTLASCHAAAGDLVASERLLASTVPAARALGNPPQLWQALLAYGRVLHSNGRVEDARAVWQEGAAVAAAAYAGLPSDVRTALEGASSVDTFEELVR